MRLSYLAIITLFCFSSCAKTEETRQLPYINEVSGKLKQIVSGVPGTRKTQVSTFTYDIAGRVKDYRIQLNDSALNPLIVASDYFSFSYELNDPKPVSALHTNHNGSINEMIYYNYDSYNRVIKEELYRNGLFQGANDYNYLTNIFTRVTSSVNLLIDQRVDTAWLDGSRNIVLMKSYSIANPNAAPLTVSLAYDTKKNPIGETNIGIFIKSFFVEDNTVFYLTPNNVISQNGNITGTPVNTNVYYEYSTNGFPVSATFANNSTSSFIYF